MGQADYGTQTLSSTLPPLRQQNLPPGHRPTFQIHFLLPRYWGTWTLILSSVLLALVPGCVRTALADYLSPIFLRHATKRKHIAMINLSLCYPRLSDEERLRLLSRHTRILVHVFLGYGQLLFRSPKHLQSRFDIEGLNIVESATMDGKSIILLTPHSLALEYAAQYLTIDYPMAGIVRVHTNNDVLDWLVSRLRTRYRGIIYDNRASMLGLVKQVRGGYWLYYLPDEDRGAQNTLFAPFYGVPKATQPLLGKLARSCKAVVIPMTTAYCPNRHRFSIRFHASLKDFTGTDLQAETVRQNKALELILDEDPAQYMWSTKIFRTRPNGLADFY